MSTEAQSALVVLSMLAGVTFVLALACAGLDRVIASNSLEETINFDFYRSIAFCELCFVAAVAYVIWVPGFAEVGAGTVVLLIAADSWVPFYLLIRGHRLWRVVRIIEPRPVARLLVGHSR